MLTHVLVQLAQQDWVAEWLREQLGQPYTYVAVADSYLEFTLEDHSVQQISVGQLVLWLQSTTDSVTTQLLYVLCCTYDVDQLNSILREAVSRILKVKVGPGLFSWRDADAGVFTIAGAKSTPKSTDLVWVRDMDDNSYVIWWKHSDELHRLLVTHLKNIAVRNAE